MTTIRPSRPDEGERVIEIWRTAVEWDFGGTDAPKWKRRAGRTR